MHTKKHDTSRVVGMATSVKSGWRRHVACDDKREKRFVVVMISQKEGAWRNNNSCRDL